MANIAAKLSLNVPAITALCKGDPGLSIRNGAGVPTPAIGIDGDFYLDTTVYNMYGPKTAGLWGSPTQLSNLSESPRWNSSYSTISALSARWNSTFTSVYNTSANWNSVYSTTRAYSGDWSGAYTMAQSVSSNVFANSGSWNSTKTSVYNASANWSSVYSYVNSTSGATVGGALTVLNSNSSNWNAVYTSVYNTSASWNSTNTSVYNTSANWSSVYSYVNSTSGATVGGALTVLNSNSSNWNAVYTSVYNTSASWNNAYTKIQSVSSNVFTNSAKWDDTNATVWSFSGGWGSDATTKTTLNTFSGGWQNVYNFWDTQWTTFSGNVALRLNDLSQLESDLYDHQWAPINGNTIDIDLDACKTYSIKLSADINTINISNPEDGTTTFTLLMIADGTTRSITWPSRVVWGEGITPTPTTALNRTDIFTFISVNSGQKYFGTFVGSAYP